MTWRIETQAHTRRAAVLGLLLSCTMACSGGEDSGDESRPESSAVPAASLDTVPEQVDDRVASVAPRRIMRDVRTLAKGPRHAVRNHAAALAAADHIDTELAAAGLEPERIDVDAHGVSLSVVWAEIAGTSCADHVFVLTGHYDTVEGSPGADDDATGVAAVLETARVLADARPDAGIVLAGLPFEEFGIPYPAADALGRHLVEQGRAVEGMVSAEMLGYAAPEPGPDGDPEDYLHLLGHRGAEEMVATFAGAAARWAPDVEIQAGTYPPETDFIDRSDHAAFHRLGIPAAFATDGAEHRTPHYHQPDDVPENIVRDFFTGSVQALVAGSYAFTMIDADHDGAADACE